MIGMAGEHRPCDIWSTWAICTVARSGSSWLCDLVTSTGMMGYPDEYLLDWPKQCLRNGLPSSTSLEDYICFLLCERSTPNGVFAIKGSLNELKPYFALFPDAPCVWLSREDKVAQAVSWCRANDGGIWTRTAFSPQGQGAAPLSLDRMLGFYDEIQRRDASWRDFFLARQTPPLALTYEQVCENPLAAVRGIATHLGLSAAQIHYVHSPLQIVREEESADWSLRLREAIMDVSLGRRAGDPQCTFVTGKVPSTPTL